MKKDHSENLLPNKAGMGPVQNKINNIHNCAYVDSFATYLMSYLVEKKLCPAFPLFFGTFSGISEKFMYDITEEYNSIKKILQHIQSFLFCWFTTHPLIKMHTYRLVC